MSGDIQIISVIGANGQPLPIHGNSIGSNWSAPVKQERADEAEIQELAAKMLETQKAALAKQQQQAAQLASRQAVQGVNGLHPVAPMPNGQTNIMNYMARQQKLPNGGTNGTAANITASGRSANGNGNGDAVVPADKKSPCDEESQKGHFGWTTFNKVFIPYIYRQQEKYCSVRMIELKLLGKYLNCLHPDIYSSCTSVRSYYITEAEARLFIEINSRHCDGEFGRDHFTQKDLVVRLSDASKFYQFLDICYRKLISGSKSPSEKCGFIRINKESVVPYTVRNNEQVVPLFYFEGETENLKQKADYLSGWDLAYLKFCCKVQGIRNELFSSENVAVISLTDIKSYFPNGTEFEDYWPSKVVDSNLLIGNRSTAHNAVNWTRQPTQPPPKVMPQQNLGVPQKSSHVSAAAAVAAAQQQSLLKHRNSAAAANAFAAQTAAVAAAAAAMQQPGAAGVAQRMHSNAALTQATMQQALNGLTNGSWMSQQPLLHAQMLASQAQQSHPSSRAQYRNLDSLMLNRQPYTYNNTAISMQPVNSHAQGNAPPPLVRSAAGQNANHMSSVEQTMLQQQQTQQQQQQHTRHHTIPHTNPNPALPPNIAHGHAHVSPGGSGNASHPYSSNFNLAGSSAPATPSDYTNLAFWNQLTPAQRLLLTQQIKSTSSVLGPNCRSTPPFPPTFSSLPLDTDLKTMLDYNPNKSKHGANPVQAVTSLSNGHFTKPSVPPLIPVHAAEAASKRINTPSPSHGGANVGRYGAGAGAGAGAGGASSSTSSGTAAATSVPLNSQVALKDFEKKFKMTDEMKAVVQKVLSNPDLSTFIQTNSSSTFVPFISPPISPATGAATIGAAASGAGSHNALSLLNNPNVTITPQLPAHFAHSPSSLSPNPTTIGGHGNGNGSGSGSGSISNSRQKSVICSTSAAGVAHHPSHVPPSPSPSSTSAHSAATPSPSPTRLGNSKHHHYHHYNHHNSHHHSHHSHHSQHSQHSHHSQSHHPQAHPHQNSHPHHHKSSPMEVIDLSSPRRSSLQAAYLQQQQQQQQQAQQAVAVAAAQQQRMAAVAQHHAQQNGRSAGSSSASASANSASMHLQRHAALAAAQDSAQQQRLCVIPEIPNANALSVQPYKVQKVYVDNHLVPCINMKAYNDSEQLMTLTDFQKYFFPTVPLEQCKRLIEALGVELYKGNRRQIQILMENDRTHNENIPLVQVRDIIKYMTQLTFMIRNQEQPPAKRTRIS